MEFSVEAPAFRQGEFLLTKMRALALEYLEALLVPIC
jgi:hypothetical protein